MPTGNGDRFVQQHVQGVKNGFGASLIVKRYRVIFIQIKTTSQQRSCNRLINTLPAERKAFETLALLSRHHQGVIREGLSGEDEAVKLPASGSLASAR